MKWDSLVRRVALCLVMSMVVLAFASSAQLPTPRYNSIKSYEALLHMQEDLIKSFESLLKNTTFTQGTGQDLSVNQSYKFLFSFDDLASRQQKGIYSFEDLSTYNWTELNDTQKISLTNSYEDLLHSEFSVLSSNEDLLKREFCKLDKTNQQLFLDKFEARIKFEKVLLSKFEAWLHYQQTIELNPNLKSSWFEYLDSFEQLIREQSMLLSSFEDLAKFRCDRSLLSLDESVSPTTVNNGGIVTYTFTIRNNDPTHAIQSVNVTDYLGGNIWTNLYLPPTAGQTTTRVITQGHCVDCVNCSCKVSDWSWACGEVVTPNGNYTICVNSAQNTILVNDNKPPLPHPYPGISPTEVAANQTVNSDQAGSLTSEQATTDVQKTTEVTATAQSNKPCLTCGKK